MAELQVTEDGDGLWTVSVAGLTVTDLDQATAEAFAAAYRRAPGEPPAGHGRTGPT